MRIFVDTSTLFKKYVDEQGSSEFDLLLDAAGLPKWELVAPGGLLPPLTFGVVPAEATERVAAVGAPSSADSVLIELDGMGRDGVAYTGVGTAARP